MRWLALGVVLTLVGCDFEAQFERYCFETGNCRCTGADCCAERGQDCAALPCCDGMQCTNDGKCGGDVQLSFEPSPFSLGEVPPFQAPQTVRLSNTGVVPTGPLSFQLSPTIDEVVLDDSDCRDKSLASGESCSLVLSLRAHRPAQLYFQITAFGRFGTAGTYFDARWGAGLSLVEGSEAHGTRLVSDPPGIDCPGSCDVRFDAGTTVVLSANDVPAVSILLESPCDGGLPCTLAMDQERHMNVEVVPWLHLVLQTTPDATSQGQVRIEPGAQVCEVANGGDCELGLSGLLTLSPERGRTYGYLSLGRAPWKDGPCQGQEPACMLEVQGPVLVTTVFGRPNATGSFIINVSEIGPDGAGADRVCQQYFSSSSFAWVFTSTHDPRLALGDFRGWSATYSWDPLLDRISDATSGRVRSEPFPGAYDMAMVSGLRPDGGLPAPSDVCADFTSTVGTMVRGTGGYGGVRWFYDPLAPPLPCAGAATVLCLEARTELLVLDAPAPSRVRQAFVSTPWVPLGGVAAADQHCGADATGAGLSGTFRALVGPTGMTAGERFSLPPDTAWANVTGTRVYRGISTWPYLNIDVQGRVVASDGNVASGTFVWSDGPNTGDDQTCSSWTGSGGTGAVRLLEGGGVYQLASCSTAQRLLCFEDD